MASNKYKICLHCLIWILLFLVHDNFGHTYTEKCSENCKDRRCKADGSCKNGCSMSVLHGTRCSKEYPEGCLKRECYQSGRCLHGCNYFVWGTDCGMKCSKSCKTPKDHDLRVCNETTGQCLHGCAETSYWGANCTSLCNANCRYQTCDSQTGICAHGCIEDYEGDNCSRKKEDTIVGFIIGMVIGIMTLTAIIYLALRRLP